MVARRTLARNLWRSVRKLYADLYRLLGNLEEAAKREADLEELADAAFAVQRCGEQLRARAVRFEQTSAVLQKLACARRVSTSSADPIHGRWVTATPDARVNPRVPSFGGDPEGYAAMCRHFGVPADGLFRPHWPTIREMVN